MRSIGKLVIIGVGLIGGSFALAMKRAGLVQQVVGVGRSLDNLNRAIELGVIDAASQDLKQTFGDREVGVPGPGLGGLGVEEGRVEGDRGVEVVDVEGELDAVHDVSPGP